MQKTVSSFDVIILGAGASGLFCAATAAQQGKRVLVLEKANKVGKKILMSGGGRCNFTNRYVEPDHFICSNPHFVKSALKRYTQWDFIDLVEQNDIPYEERSHNQLFCIHSAKDILNMLLNACDLGNVIIKTHCDIKCISALNASKHASDNPVTEPDIRYQVTFNKDKTTFNMCSRSLVVATGALSIPTLGGSGFGYELAQQFDIPVLEKRAGLVPFMFSDSMKPICQRLSGLALNVSVTCRGETFEDNMLFTHRGMSGPVMLQISNYWMPGDELTANLLPAVNATSLLLNAKRTQHNSLLRTLLNKHLSKSLVSELQRLFWPDHTEKILAEFNDRTLKDIGNIINHWVLKPAVTEGYRTAEVTLGGVDTDAISSKTMEVKQVPGLFFIGEVLDVTGHLGGFNFQWAWSSGYTAGLFV